MTIFKPELIDKYGALAKIPPWHLKRLLRDCQQDPVRFAQSLVADEWMERESAGRVFGDSFGFAYVSLSQTLFQPKLLATIPRAVAEKEMAIPIYKMGDVVTVAMAYPDNGQIREVLERIMMCKISPVFSFPDEIHRAIRIHYETAEDLDDLINKFDVALLGNADGDDSSSLEKLSSSKQIVRIADTLLLIGIKENASDVHLESKRHSLNIRYRIDGVLRDRFSLPKELAVPIVARYKVMAKMDVVDKRGPQDGRLSIKLPVSSVDVRASCVPTLNGEKIVLRIIGSRFTQDMLSLDKMNITPDLLGPLKKVLRNPNGLLLVSGPTGSGKTTTLYAALNYVNRPDINVVTIEDPVEYDNAHINQVQVNRKEGRTFDTVLRSVLRQDPDVILVGEIRDIETARVVAQAALTGHLVLTTVHTGSALQALTRLVDMGVERFIVAPSIIGVMGQRLLRRLCDFCKTPYVPEQEEMSEFFRWSSETPMPTLFRAMGCPKCGNTGYSGRIAIHEFLKVEPAVRDYILQGRPHHEVADLAVSLGFKDVRYDGFRKALLGLTTMDEVCRVTAEFIE